MSEIFDLAALQKCKDVAKARSEAELREIAERGRRDPGSLSHAEVQLLCLLVVATGGNHA